MGLTLRSCKAKNRPKENHYFNLLNQQRKLLGEGLFSIALALNVMKLHLNFNRVSLQCHTLNHYQQETGNMTHGTSYW